MGEYKVEDISLPALFGQARKIHLTATESCADQDLIKKGCSALGKCEDMISKIGLFSSNESKDDISTTNLKYLLVPFYLAELTEKLAQDERIQVLKIVMAKLKDFVSFCEAMELVPKEELESYGQGASNSFADRRALKIARFRRQRAAEAKLTEIKERKEWRGRSTKAAAVSTPVEVGEDDLLDDDGEEEREALRPGSSLLLESAFGCICKALFQRKWNEERAWLTTISLAICKGFDLLEMLNKEEQMLSAIKEKQLKEGEKEFSEAILDDRAKKAEAWHREAAARVRYTQPAAPITCATFAQDVLEGRANVLQAHDHKHQPLIFGPQSLIGGSLTSERERIAAQVFQPSHRMPTMSIEEAGLKEMEIMNKWQESNAKMFEEANSAWHKEKPKMGPSEDDEDDDAAAQDKARAWDDWKDDNPRGAGNKKLTPCG